MTTFLQSSVYNSVHVIQLNPATKRNPEEKNFLYGIAFKVEFFQAFFLQLLIIHVSSVVRLHNCDVNESHFHLFL